MAFLRDWWSGSAQEPKEEENENVVEEEEASGKEKGAEQSPDSGSESGTMWNVKFDAQSLSKGVGGGLAVVVSSYVYVLPVL